jgi:hypothetical protein
MEPSLMTLDEYLEKRCTFTQKSSAKSLKKVAGGEEYDEPLGTPRKKSGVLESVEEEFRVRLDRRSFPVSGCGSSYSSEESSNTSVSIISN